MSAGQFQSHFATANVFRLRRVALAVGGAGLLLLAGCATVDVNKAIARADQDVGGLTGGKLALAQTDQVRSELRSTATALLAKPLSADDAVHLALVNSPAMQALLKDKLGVHSARRGYAKNGRYGEGDAGRSMAIRYDDSALATQTQPIARVHPETGRTALFVSPGYTIGIRAQTVGGLKLGAAVVMAGTLAVACSDASSPRPRSHAGKRSRYLV